MISVLPWCCCFCWLLIIRTCSLFKQLLFTFSVRDHLLPLSQPSSSDSCSEFLVFDLACLWPLLLSQTGVWEDFDVLLLNHSLTLTCFVSIVSWIFFALDPPVPDPGPFLDHKTLDAGCYSQFSVNTWEPQAHPFCCSPNPPDTGPLVLSTPHPWPTSATRTSRPTLTPSHCI